MPDHYEAALNRWEDRRHSSVCVDTRECDGVDHCICEPDQEKAPPDTYELWWCSYCGEPSFEDSDPCQCCGEKIARVAFVAAEHAARIRSEAERETVQRIVAALATYDAAISPSSWAARFIEREFGCEDKGGERE